MPSVGDTLLRLCKARTDNLGYGATAILGPSGRLRKLGRLSVEVRNTVRTGRDTAAPDAVGSWSPAHFAFGVPHHGDCAQWSVTLKSSRSGILNQRALTDLTGQQPLP